MRFTITPLGGAVTRTLARSTGEITAWELHNAAQPHALQRHIDAIELYGPGSQVQRGTALRDCDKRHGLLGENLWGSPA